jgi:hypothetical protein
MEGKVVLRPAVSPSGEVFFLAHEGEEIEIRMYKE